MEAGKKVLNGISFYPFNPSVSEIEYSIFELDTLTDANRGASK